MATTAQLVDLVVRAMKDPHNHDAHNHDAHNHGDHHDHDHGTNSTATSAAAGTGYCTATACMRNWKIAFAVILFVEGVLFGYLPLLLRRFACLETKRFRTLLSFVNVGGGGIFLATGMLHILPEALELLQKSEKHGTEAPGTHTDGHGHGAHGFPVGPAVILYTFVLFLFLEKVIFPHSHGTPDEHDEGDGHTHEFSPAPREEDDEMPSKRHGVGTKTFLTYLLTTLFIGLHSILESVALGSATRWSTVINTFIAIATHRWATTMALGARYERAQLSALGYALLVVGFAFIAPLGVAIGFGVRAASDTVIGVVFALSAGIFLYVGAFETPAEEFVERKDLRFAKFAVFTLGCAIITIITGILVATGTNVH